MQVQYYTEKMTMKRVYYTGTDALLVGYALCYDRDNITATAKSAGLHLGSPALVLDAALTAGYENYGRHAFVEKPASGNLDDFAGVVASLPEGGTTPGTGPGWIDIIEPDAIARAQLLYTEESCTINSTLLTVKAGSYAFGGIGEGPVVAQAVQTVDRSTTNGLVQALLFPPPTPGSSFISTAAGAGPSPLIWESCPWDLLVKNPALGNTFFDDFTAFPPILASGNSGPYYGFIDTGDTITQVATLTTGGAKVLSAATDNNGPILYLGGGDAGGGAPHEIVSATGKDFWLEARIRVSSAALTEAGLFVGLAEEGAAVDTGIISDNPDTDLATMMEDLDFIGWASFTNAAPTFRAAYLKAAGTMQSDADSDITIVLNTWYKVGMHFDVAADTLNLYQDGVLTWTFDVSVAGSTDFPSGENMGFAMCVKSGSAAARSMGIDWLRIAQLY